MNEVKFCCFCLSFGIPSVFSCLEMSDVDASPVFVVDDDDEDNEIVPEASQQCKHIHIYIQ